MKTRLALSMGLWMAAAAFLTAEGVNDHLSVPLSNPGKPGHVEVGLLKGSITITGYEGSEVDVTARTETGDTDSDDEKKGVNGMFRIPVASSELEIEESNNHVEIDVQSMKYRVDLEIKVPFNTSLSVSTVNEGDIRIDRVNGEIEAENVNGSITMTGVSGSVAASTTNGDVKIELTRINPEKPMSFNSFNGNVDVTLPAAVKAGVKIKTQNGDVYSDFNILKTDNPNAVKENKREKGGKYRVVIEHGFYGTIGGGGPEFSFSTYNGDILVRKAK